MVFQSKHEGQAIRAVLDRAIAGKWESFTPPGEGTEWRIEGDDFAAASLVWDEKVVMRLHVFPKQPALDGVVYRPRIRGRYGRD